MKKINMGGFLKGVSIVVAAGTLISAIFSKDPDKEISEIVDKKVAEALASKE